MKNTKIYFVFGLLALLMISTACGPNYDDCYSDAGFDEAFLAELSPEERAQVLADYYGDEEYDEEGSEESFSAQYISNAQNGNRQMMNQQNAQNTKSGNSGQPTKTVQIYDRGYGMVMVTTKIPQSWNVDQNLATNRQLGNIASYKLDYYGPDGSLVRFMMPTNYSSYFGQSFQSVWNQLMRQYLYSAVQRVQFQQMQRNPKILSTRFAQDYAKYNNGHMDGYEQRFTGRINGRQVEGVVYALYLKGQMEQLIPVAVISPRGRLQEALSVYHMIDQNARENPRYVQVVHGDMSNRAVAHSQDMQRRHQRTKQLRDDIYAIHQQQREDFNRSIREEGLGYNGSRHTINDRVTDAIRGEMTYENPYSGEQERVDQMYKYWYVNPLGQRYGTNDMNFNPQTLPGGDWSRMNPVNNY